MTQEIPPFNTLEQWLTYCEKLHSINIDMGLTRVEQVRAELRLDFSCPVITVAGTNGKGSTCAMLESILGQAGYKTGVYSSPHLVHFEERCRINGQMVNADDLLSSFEAVDTARKEAGNISLSYFEFTTLAIMHYMSLQGLDVAILEVGLGGRLDAVNIIDCSCAIITCVDVDHTDYLGFDREVIGFEKAGIMRQGRPAVVGDPNPPLSIEEHAAAIGANCLLLGSDFNYKLTPDGWSWQGQQQSFSNLPRPALAGRNQFLNAAGVLAALEALKEQFTVLPEHIAAGLQNVHLAGRFQVIRNKNAPTLVLDVGHNPHAAKALLINLKQMGEFTHTHAVYGAMHDKDLKGVLELMLPQVSHWHVTDLPLPRAIKAVELKELLMGINQSKNMQLNVQCYAKPSDALAQAFKEAGPNDRIVVFGSFYTVGGVLEDGLPKA